MPFDVRGSGRGWFVFLDGQRVSSGRCKAGQAHALAEKMERAVRIAPRACMTCGAGFPSEGPHNRLCDSCRKLGATPDFGLSDPDGVGRSDGR